MTVRLYYLDPYQAEFTADLVGCREEGGRFHLVLDRTAFFPEGGGQPSDRGWIEEIAVEQVYEAGGRVCHVLGRVPAARKGLRCRVDWERRFDHMQQHLGQHLLSAALRNRFAASTVGFHLGREVCTIDLDRFLNGGEIAEAEQLANRVVFANRAVEAVDLPAEELRRLDLQRLPRVDQGMRLIRIADFDLNPCCGTHPRRTGEVGLVKVRRSERYKGGTRVEFVCGGRALMDYSRKNEAVNRICARLSVGEGEAVAAVERMKEEQAALRKEVRRLRDRLLEQEAAALLATAEKVGKARVVSRVFAEREMEEVKRLAEVLAGCPGAVALLGVQHRGRGQLVFGRSRELGGPAMNQVIRRPLEMLEGRGGGSELSAQGGGSRADRLKAAVEEARAEVREALGGRPADGLE